MNRRSVLFAAAVWAVMSLAGSDAKAAGVLVTADSGSLGAFRVTNLGIAGGVTSLVLDLLDTNQNLESVNGAAVPNDANAKATFFEPILLSVTPIAGPANTFSVSLSPATYMKTIGTGAASASMTYNLQVGLAPTGLPNFMLFAGNILSVLTNANPAYDFSAFTAPGGRINYALTATSYAGASSFNDVITTVGASATGSGAFSQISQIAVPEPASMSLLGIGLCSLFAYRRYFKKRTTSARSVPCRSDRNRSIRSSYTEPGRSRP
jgi:hypothetical protein